MIKRILLLCCIAFAAHAQRPLKWIADAVTTAPVTFDCSRGETLTFTPTLKAYGATLTNYTASFQWQTNGMGTLFWSTNVLAFTPSMDCGANRYRFFIRAESTNGLLYSAQGTINMLHAPGAIVNVLPLPVPTLNFASVSYTNAPWLLTETDPNIPTHSLDTSAHPDKVSTNDPVYIAAATAWQNPQSSTNWTWTSDGTQITLTGYNFSSMDVVIPDMLDGLPVTGYSATLFSAGAANNYTGTGITSISGGNNIMTIPAYSIRNCYSLTNIALSQLTSIGSYSLERCTSLVNAYFPKAESVGNYAFAYCENLKTVTIPEVKTINVYGFYYCTNLESVSVPKCSSVGSYSFRSCFSLKNVSFGVNAPATATGVYQTITANQVTNYVTNPSATGWGATFGGMPVVRLPLYADSLTVGGTNITSHIASKADAARTITVNGEIGTLTTNLIFNVTGGMTGSEVTNAVEALRDYHRDSYTNVIWQMVFSNGWMWLVAYTNYPAN